MRCPKGDAAKLTAGLRCAGLPWGHHACTGRVLPAVNFVSHRDLTEFFNSLLEHVVSVVSLTADWDNAVLK